MESNLISFNQINHNQGQRNVERWSYQAARGVQLPGPVTRKYIGGKTHSGEKSNKYQKIIISMNE